MKEIKIFIASSEELKHERQVFSDIAMKLNILLKSKHIKINLEKWEYLDASMGLLHKQEEYNNVLRGCDICIVLFWTIFGDYTNEEFKKALEEVNKNSNLKEVHLCFKNDFKDKEISDSLSSFKVENKDNYPQYYEFIDDSKLTYLFINMIDAYCKKYYDFNIARIEDNKLMVEHKVFVDLDIVN